MTFDPNEPELEVDEVRERVEETIETAEIALFVKGTRHMPQCGYSDKALSLVHHYRDAEDVTVVNVLQNLDAFRDVLESRSGWETIPQTFVEGEFVGGSDILVELAEREELAETLNADPEISSPESSDESEETEETDVEAPF
jgi:monothiol glutaredoxin